MIYWIDKQMLTIIYFNIFSFEQLNNNTHVNRWALFEIH